MSGTWASGWATSDVVSATEFAKGAGCVADTTLGGASASIDLTGLPTTYAHLRVVVVGRSDAAVTNTAVGLRFNGDSGANYAWEYVQGNGASASAAEGASATMMNIGAISGASAAASHPGFLEIVVPNYAGTTFYKGACSFGGVTQALTAGNMYATARAGVWASTAAVNRITLLPGSGNFIAGTRVSVYVMGS